MTDLAAFLVEHGVSSRRARRAGLEPPPRAGDRSADRSRLVGALVILVLLVTASCALFGAAWAELGRLAFSGRRTGWWWSAMLGLAGAGGALAGWASGVLGTGVGRRLRERALSQTLDADPDHVARAGLGAQLTIALDLDMCERLGADAALLVMASVAEIVVAAVVLLLADLPGLAAGLAAGVLLVVIVAVGAHAEHARASAVGAAVTNRMVERLVNHRTELVSAQTEDLRRDTVADEAIGTAADEASDRSDRCWLAALGLSQLWSVGALIGLGVWLPAGHSRTAAGAGAISFGTVGLTSLAIGLASSSGAVLAARRLGGVGWRPDAPAPPLPLPGGPLVELDAASFRYPEAPLDAVIGVTLAIHEGDRVLLVGPSGGGKSTIGALLAGTRMPSSGVRRTGRRAGRPARVVVVPQFNDNHVFSDTLGFNLLCGRAWPPSPADVRAAQEMAQAVGLGELLSRAPAGLGQPVGDFGWQLSHGERSRLFVARALLQQPDVLILDESFAAIDPLSIAGLLEAASTRCHAMILVAHP